MVGADVGLNSETLGAAELQGRPGRRTDTDDAGCPGNSGRAVADCHRS